MAKKRRIPFRDAMDLVPDDMPDGAYWAMAHDIAGLEYGDGFDYMICGDTSIGQFACKHCTKVFGSDHARSQHTRDKHGKAT